MNPPCNAWSAIVNDTKASTTGGALGKKIIHMEVGEPDFMPPIKVKQSLEEVYDKGFTKYGQAKGLPQFRTALAEYVTKKFNANTAQENILVSPGARFSIFLAITTLLNRNNTWIMSSFNL